MWNQPMNGSVVNTSMPSGNERLTGLSHGCHMAERLWGIEKLWRVITLDLEVIFRWNFISLERSCREKHNGDMHLKFWRQKKTLSHPYNCTREIGLESGHLPPRSRRGVYSWEPSLSFLFPSPINAPYTMPSGTLGFSSPRAFVFWIVLVFWGKVFSIIWCLDLWFQVLGALMETWFYSMCLVFLVKVGGENQIFI